MVEHTVQKIGDKVGIKQTNTSKNFYHASLKMPNSHRLATIGQYQEAWLQSPTRVSSTSTAVRTSRQWRISYPRGPPPPTTGPRSSPSPRCTKTTAPSRTATRQEAVILEPSADQLTTVLAEMKIATEKV